VQPPQALSIIEGELVTAEGQPLSNHTIRALDRLVGQWRTVGEAKTDAQGRYKISYELTGKQRADLKVEVLDPKDAKKTLASSPLFLEAAPQQTVNFSVGGSGFKGLDEFTRVDRALTPLLSGSKPAEIQIADVLILARQAKISATKVATYLKAARWSAATKTPQPIFYALLRKGQPSNLPTLFSRPLSKLSKALEEAQRHNIVRLASGEAKAQLASAQQAYLAAAAHPLQKLLATTKLTKPQRTTFIQRLSSGAQKGEDFWKSLSAESFATPTLLADLRSLFELHEFTGGNLSLSVHLRGTKAKLKALAALDVAAWSDTILAAESIAIPAAILPGAPLAQRRAAYAHQLFRSAEAAYPTESLVGQLARQDNWKESPVSTFFAKFPDFEFTKSRVTSFQKQTPAAAALLAGNPSMRTDMLRLEQLFHLTPATDKLATLQPLWDANLSSAPQIANMGRAGVHRTLTGKLPADAIDAVYQQAAHQTATALQVYLGFQRSATPAVLAKGKSSGTKASVGLPEWEDLFGSTDSCGCSHCQSVLSPAAYLVDTMAFLSRSEGGGKTGLQVLLERRPDLGKLLLTCENTETLVPQIDLVIEILEQIVAFSTDGRTLPAQTQAQTTWDEALLAAQPEHMEPAAYDVLAAAVYPFSNLPFDLWLAETRLYLAQAGVSRYDLMRAMPLGPGVKALDFSNEALGLSRKESELIRTPVQAAAKLAAAWGLSANPVPQLRRVETLLKQARFDYAALRRLLTTRFLNPSHGIGLDFKGDPCSLANAELTGDLAVFLDRLPRFVRMQRCLGWSEYQLDQVLAALKISDFDQAGCFAALTALRHLEQATKVNVSELATWWSNVDTFAVEADAVSQYEAIFLDPRLFTSISGSQAPTLVDKVFALTADRSDLAITTSTDPALAKAFAAVTGPSYTLQPEYALHIQAATGLDSIDVQTLVDRVLAIEFPAADIPLNLATVSFFYRISSFLRALGLPLSDFLWLMRLSSAAPVSTPPIPGTPESTWTFRAQAQEVQAFGQPIEEMAYLLLQDAAAAVYYQPPADQVAALLAELSSIAAGATVEAVLAGSIRTSITQSLGVSLQLDAAIVDAVLATHRPRLGRDLAENLLVAAHPASPIVPARSFAQVYETLHKFAIAWRRLGLDSTHLAFVMDKGPALGWADLTSFPLTSVQNADPGQWLRLMSVARLQQRVFAVEQPLFGLLEIAAASPFDAVRLLNETALRTGWNSADLAYLFGPSGFKTTRSAFRDERWILALDRVLTLIRPLGGVSAQQASQWAGATLTYANAQSARQAVSLRYGIDQWNQVSVGLQNQLRTLRRDALLAHLLSTFPANNPADIYDHYLIDPEMTPDAKTSRLVAAHASVQTLAQRILLNLELPLKFDRDDSDAWYWRKNYRVWEAARKIFLFPENWLEPELRDDKSPFFEELEDALLQDDVTQTTAERVLRDYLSKLMQVSQLETMALCREDNDTTWHAFARTREVPPSYFYRRWEDEARWTPWEPIVMDIQADHLVPVVYNSRLILFWPNLKVTELTAPEVTNSQFTDGGTIEEQMSDIEAQITYLESLLSVIPWGLDSTKDSIKSDIKKREEDLVRLEEALRLQKEVAAKPYEIELSMSWSEYRDGVWLPKTTSRATTKYSDIAAPKHVFVASVEPDNFLKIRVQFGGTGYGGGEGYHTTPDAYFYWSGCTSGLMWAPESGAGSPSTTVEVCGAQQNFQSWKGYTLGLDLKVRREERTLLGTVPSHEILMLPANQYGFGGAVKSPFFVWDGVRTYFVNVLTSAGIKAAVKAEPAKPIDPDGLATRQDHYYSGISTSIVTKDLSSSGSALFTTSSATKEQQAIESLLASDSLPDFDLERKELSTSRVQYRFENFYHPYACLFVKQFLWRGVDGLLNPNPRFGPEAKSLDRQLTPDSSFNFKKTYDPDSFWVSSDHPVEDIDFKYGSAYGAYNWEIFFHIPLLVATRLMENQRHSDARKWFHYIFDPTNTDENAPASFWKVRPFYEEQLASDVQRMQDFISLLASGDSGVQAQIAEWEEDPFQPHTIARLRMEAYMQTTVMKYLDCLIAEADMLFGQDTRESINEAVQLYLMASRILGQKPVSLPEQTQPTVTPDQLLGNGALAISNPLLNISPFIPGVPLSAAPTSSAGVDSYATFWMFCLPKNDKLYGYWDIVADRLFKIRHSMNLAGVSRQLALFAPPIDPALLVRATAAGLDIAAIVSGLNAPLPHYRFAALFQKALELTNEVRNLGAALLSALEKRDGEDIANLRAKHEVSLLGAIRSIRSNQVAEANASLESLRKSREAAEARYEYYSSRERVSTGEQKSLDKQQSAMRWQWAAQAPELASALAYLGPQVILKVGFPETEWGGLQLGAAGRAAAGAMQTIAAQESHAASKSAVLAGYARRQQDWKFQAESAKRDIEQLDKQILAAEIRRAITETEAANHEKQLAQSEEVEDFLRSKFTNRELYGWMISQTSSRYFEAYQLALNMARKAEQAMQRELGLSTSPIIQASYWDSLRKGLFTGEALHGDLRRLEAAYLEQNRREFELSKTVSLAAVDPLALVQLRETGRCFFAIGEEWFDLDYPGHYFRRIKGIAVTLPCVVGSVTTASCTLRLQKNSVRTNTLNGTNGYRRNTDSRGLPSDDPRFVENPVTVTSIATSRGQNDPGMFEFNFQDERYLPFEGAGVISDWVLELFTDTSNEDNGKPLRQFDYNTISDAFIHVSYTSREDAGPFKTSAIDNLRSFLGEGMSSLKMISLRQEFPTQWQQFLNPADASLGYDCSIELSPKLFPYRDQNKTLQVDHIWIISRSPEVTDFEITLTPPLPAIPASSSRFVLTRVPEYGDLRVAEKDVSRMNIEVANSGPVAKWTVHMTPPGSTVLRLDDLVMILGYHW
jgi:hypothetical protein